VEDFSTSALVKAIEASLCQYAIYAGQSPQVELSDQADMLWYSTGIPTPIWNGVLRTELAPNETDSRIAAVVDYFRSRGLPMAWWIGPSTRPLDLDKRLEAQGFFLVGDNTGMAVDLAELEERSASIPGFVIRPVRDSETLKEWAHPFGVSFGLPESTSDAGCELVASMGLGPGSQLQNYVGLLNGKPVASSSVFLGADVAGIYNVGTLPDHRRQGIGAAMTREPLYYAREMGYRIGILHSSPAGFNAYRQIGFREYCKIKTYVLLPSSPQD